MSQQIIPDDENYVSSEDSDFAPDIASRDEEVSDEDSQLDEDTTQSDVFKRKKHGPPLEKEKHEFENSGDETVIVQGKKKAKKKAKKNAKEGQQKTYTAEDVEGQDSLIRTRSMYALDKVERKKTSMPTTAVTIDVDAVWQAMVSGKPLPTMETLSAAKANSCLSEMVDGSQNLHESCTDTHAQDTIIDDGQNSMITIKRTYNFAGKIHEEEKVVPRNSAEAKLYMTTHSNASTEPPSKKLEKPKRPLKLAYRSIFEPVPENMPKRTDLHFGTRRANRVLLAGVVNQEKKLNTVQKSAIDWASFVDKEGISDELDAAGKSKGAFKARQEFLARVEQKKEEQARRAKGLVI
ncbi:hypothetical protein K3495_g4422 [Podosphaera aphanis]|nr:hypothetical protein K3495_g4422 [Podosphaera aphanis]